MIGLDLRSILLMTSAMGLLLALVLVFLRLSYPKSIQGLGLWATALVLVFASALLFAGRDVIPDLFSVVLANFMLLSGIVFFYTGTQCFLGRQPSFKLLLGVSLATVPLVAWYTLMDPNFNARTLVVSSVWAGMNFSLAWLVWHQGRSAFATRFVAGILLLHAGILVLRFLSAWLPLPGENLLKASSVQTLYIAANAMMLLAVGIGFILMASDRLREELEHVASHDSLTNALMRRTLIAASEPELERCRRHGRSMGLLMLDIDHFKAINDTHGHQMGDRVLVDFVQRITPLLRRPDLLGRFGGEEFVVLLPETSQEEAVAVAERLREAIASPLEGMPPVTVSIGVTSNRPDDARIDALLARVDRALYKAKAAGRNRIAVA
jgi:diguanylate cyclase (GGDEF)-like protein